ncbi:MAG: hypothetical protein ACLQBX_02785 [Candidatus Limnocylindrales bacterium]
MLHDDIRARVQGRPERAAALPAETLEALGVPTLASVLAALPRGGLPRRGAHGERHAGRRGRPAVRARPRARQHRGVVVRRWRSGAAGRTRGEMASPAQRRRTRRRDPRARRPPRMLGSRRPLAGHRPQEREAGESGRPRRCSVDGVARRSTTSSVSASSPSV